MRQMKTGGILSGMPPVSGTDARVWPAHNVLRRAAYAFFMPAFTASAVIGSERTRAPTAL